MRSVGTPPGIERLGEEPFQRLRGLVAEAAGLLFDEPRQEALTAAVLSRIRASGVASAAEYVASLMSPDGREERQRLLEQLTIQETCFLRHPEQFRALEGQVLPELDRRSAGRILRFWSAGCATGEEAYSLAMVVLEHRQKWAGPAVEIVGTDLSETALARARRGRYGGRTVRLLPPDLLDRYFIRRGDEVEVRDEVRALVRFEPLNLAVDPFPVARFAGLDVIFCRNVTIYFTPEATRRLVGIFERCLSPAGVLFLGPSESLWQLSSAFDLVEWGGAFAYRKRDPQAVPAVSPTAARPPAPRRPGRHPRPARRAASPRPRLDAAALAVEAALVAVEQGDAGGAALALQAALEADPRSLRAVVLLGYLHASRGEWGAAGDLAARAVRIDPLAADGHILEGLVLRGQRREAEALEAFRRAVYLEPDQPLARYQLGQILAGRGESSKAARQFAEALEAMDRSPTPSVFHAAYPASSLRHACRLSLERARPGG